MSDISESADLPPKPESWLWGEALAVRSELFLATCWGVAAGMMIIVQAWLLAAACHLVVIGRQPLEVLLPLAGGVTAVVLVRSLLTYLAESRSLAAAARVKAAVRRRLYARLLQLGPAGVTGEETGSLVEAVTTAVDGLEPYVARFLPNLVLAGVLPLMVLCLVLPCEWRSGLVLLFSAPFIPLFMVLIGRGSESLHRRQWVRLSRMAGHLLDLVQGLADLKIFGAAQREANLVAQIADDYRRGTMALLRVAFLSAFTLEFFATVGTALVAVLVGFRLLGGELSLADGLFVLLVAPEFYLPLRNLGLSYHSRMQGVAAAERISPLLAMPLPTGYSGTMQLPAGPPEIAFSGVSFRYGGGRGGVSDIDLLLPAGSLTALAGESGSGKSTIVRLLTGMARPADGGILVNGADLEQYDPAVWRSRIALVPQRPFFFTGSIRENLLLGCPAASEESIRQALAAAAALEFIEKLPSGLATKLGDRGAGLSGGELKRLALARAYLRDAGLLVLDEPTSGLDSENERLAGEALLRLAKGRTVLLISHREETLALADRIIILSAGRVERVLSKAEYLAERGGA